MGQKSEFAVAFDNTSEQRQLINETDIITTGDNGHRRWECRSTVRGSIQRQVPREAPAQRLE